MHRRQHTTYILSVSLFVCLLAGCLCNHTWGSLFLLSLPLLLFFAKKAIEAKKAEDANHVFCIQFVWTNLNLLTTIMSLYSLLKLKQSGHHLFLVSSILCLGLHLKHRKSVDTHRSLSLGAPLVLSTYAGPSKVTGGRMQLERPPALPAKPHCWEERPSLWKAELKKIHLACTDTRNCVRKWGHSVMFVDCRRLHKVNANDILFVSQPPNCKAGYDSPRKGIVIFKHSQNSSISGREMFEKKALHPSQRICCCLVFLVPNRCFGLLATGWILRNAVNRW